MKKLNEEEDITFLVVSHDVSITDIADRVLHLMDGRITDEPPDVQHMRERRERRS
jgi:ABC-type glutathione transport system ATPase component